MTEIEPTRGQQYEMVARAIVGHLKDKPGSQAQEVYDFLFGAGVDGQKGASRWSVLMTLFVTLMAGDESFNDLITSQWQGMRTEMRQHGVYGLSDETQH